MTGSASRIVRRRLSLLASSSLVAASLMAGMGGVAVLAVAPTAAFAANECGDPAVNGGAADTFVCAGPIAGGVSYVSDGNLTLQMEDGVNVTGGINVMGGLGDTLTIRSITTVPGAGDTTVANAGGTAIRAQSAGSASVIVDLRNNDAGDGPTNISGGRGIQIINATGAGRVLMNGGSITTTAGNAIDINAAGGAQVSLVNTTVNANNGNGVRIQSTGDVSVNSNNAINATGAGVTVATQGDISITTSSVTAGGPAGIRP